MRLLFCGDIVGRSGRDVVCEKVPQLRRDLRLDFVIASGDNPANGFGITKDICEDLTAKGVDVITGGDHVWDHSEAERFIGSYHALLRPHNYPEHNPGTGARVYTNAAGRKLLVLHLQGQSFMKYHLDDPFSCADEVLKFHKMGANIEAILVDFHAEATAEKMGLGAYLDGRVSCVVGSHTHVPTADTMILPGGTAYQTDAGMCGDYNSVIGFSKEISLKIMRAKRKIHERMVPAQGEGTLCGTFVETDDKTGLAKRIEPVRVGGRLAQALPVC
ncbi:MAG: metallophosphoesterase [Rickettsiales bacterium]|nr:metallophosphoesterase [Rickettsiales bacterium]